MCGFCIEAAAAFPERRYHGNFARNRRRRVTYPKSARYEGATDPRGKNGCEVELKTAGQRKSRMEYQRTDLDRVVCPSFYIPPSVDECLYSGGINM